MLDDLALFVTIVEEGSLNAAAKSVALPTATVTRRLQKLEKTLGYRLLNRSARRMQPTAEGLQYYEQCRPLVHALRQTTQRLDATLGAVAGSIRVLAPIDFASGVLTPAWAGFLQKYPDVQLELDLANATQDLIGSGADLAIRVGTQDDSSLMQRRLSRIELALVAAPQYLEQAGTPEKAGDLNRHAIIVADPLRDWPLRDPASGETTVVRVQPRFRANEIRVAVGMAKAGLGILLCPLVYCHESLQKNELVSLLPGWLPPPRDAYAVWSQQRYLPARVRALLDHLVEFAERNPLL